MNTITTVHKKLAGTVDGKTVNIWITVNAILIKGKINNSFQSHAEVTFTIWHAVSRRKVMCC